MIQSKMRGSEMVYTLRTQRETYRDGEIDASLINDIIHDFLGDGDEFIVMEPSVPIEGSIYLQATGDPDGSGSIVIEQRIVHPDQTFQHYSRLIADAAEVVRIFLDYWEQQRQPDPVGWKDISDQFR